MKLLIVALLVSIVTMAASKDLPREFDLEDAPNLFEKFIKDYDRTYQDEDDKKAHYEAFVESLKTINESNKKNPSATFGINKFADYTPEEKKNLFGFGVNKQKQ